MGKHSWVFSVLLVGCLDYQFNPEAPVVGPGPQEPEGPESDEILSEDCDLSAREEQAATVNDEGGGVDKIDEPWEVAVEWTFGEGEEWANNSVHVPLVANLTDTDGDGAITVDDVPNVVVPTWDLDYALGSLVVLDGRNGDIVWKVDDIHGLGGHTVGDIDGDGMPDILAFDSSHCPTLLSHLGETKWTATVCSNQSFTQSTMADLTADGLPEVITEVGIYNGQTGALKVAFNHDFAAEPYVMPTIGDIDLDGEQEVILGSRVYGPDGTIEWTANLRGSYGHWGAVLNVDLDAEGEVLMVGEGELLVLDSDGTELSRSDVGGSHVSPPCAADFDGDGQTEIAWAGQDVFVVYRLDGTEVWRQDIQDQSGLSGCAGYDINGDGGYEIVYSDEGTFYIFDGASGDILYGYEGHRSATAFEYPSIADIDNDGSAEILFTSNFNEFDGTRRSLTVLGHDGDGWARSGSTWPTHDFSVTNVNPDASLPKDIPTYWLDQNVYRARPMMDSWTRSIDLKASISNVCYEGCADDSLVQVAIDFSNHGMEDSLSGVPVSLYGIDGEETKLIETVYTKVIPSGIQMAGQVVTFKVGDGGRDGFVVQVDDDGSGLGLELECREDNNAYSWTDTPCD
jgi:hypothetical protein